MSKIFAAPAAGVSLPLPGGRPWPVAGEWVERDEYVRRRLADGDIVEVPPPAAEEPPVSAEAEASDPETPRRRASKG